MDLLMNAQNIYCLLRYSRSITINQDGVTQASVICLYLRVRLVCDKEICYSHILEILSHVRHIEEAVSNFTFNLKPT